MKDVKPGFILVVGFLIGVCVGHFHGEAKVYKSILQQKVDVLEKLPR